MRAISMGLFVEEAKPIIWRGPMITKLLVEFVRNVLWGDLDYLVIDMPPGTGDAQLTICQQVPLSGGVIVTTPQEVALLDVKRGVTMFREVNVPVLGVVENMSYHVCRKCGAKHDSVRQRGRRAHGAADSAFRFSARCRWCGRSAKAAIAAPRSWWRSRSTHSRKRSSTSPSASRPRSSAARRIGARAPLQ